MTFLLLFIVGLLIGSFLNVVSFRYVEGKHIFGWHIMGGRSKCRTCSVDLHWYELIPVLSFIIQRGKCRHCYESLSRQYPMVEIITGFITAGLPIFFYQYFNIPQAILQGQPIAWFYIFTMLWILASYVFVLISAIDFRLRVIPDQCNVLLGAIGIVIAFLKYGNPQHFPYQGSFIGNYAQIMGQNPNLNMNLIFAIVAGLLVFGGLIFFTKGRGMGLGDLKLALPIALLLSWPDAIIAFAFAFIIGAIFGLGLIWKQKKTFKEAVPFGPFLALGVYVLIFYGQSILRWYFSLVS